MKSSLYSEGKGPAYDRNAADNNESPTKYLYFNSFSIFLVFHPKIKIKIFYIYYN